MQRMLLCTAPRSVGVAVYDLGQPIAMLVRRLLVSGEVAIVREDIELTDTQHTHRITPRQSRIVQAAFRNFRAICAILTPIVLTMRRTDLSALRRWRTYKSKDGAIFDNDKPIGHYCRSTRRLDPTSG